jgi:hypothetical protein
MIKVKFDAKKLTSTVNNIIQYSDGFIKETEKSKGMIAKKIANTSVNVFYEYLDGLARLHPGMLHHVYEWGQVGDPFARLYELSTQGAGSSISVTADFLESTSVPEKGTEPFYDKASIMESGESITITEKEAGALFFEIDGQEFFRKGPIVIENPGGEAVRGSFVQAFNEFYTVYFSEIYLRSINFYQELEKMRPYQNNIRHASKSKNARTLGKGSALEWITKLPGDDLIGS